jgi:C_GCAxxG_C_C family probable redox protein
MNDLERMQEFKQKGFYCSQILVLMGLELQGKSNPELVGAMQGLAGGLGFNGELCGALSGGACLLGLYAGKGKAETEEDPRLDFMTEDLVKWFKNTMGEKYGGIKCDDIVGNNAQYQGTRCPLIVAETYQKVKEILVENGFELTGNPDSD